MDGLLKQLLFVLEELLTRNYVVHPMHLNVWNAWNEIIVIHGEASSSTWSTNTVSESHNLPLILVSVLSFVSFEVFLLVVFWIAIV